MQVQKDYIRLKILEAALEEFSSKGFRNATMSSIAGRCMISKSNLYRYFTSKEDICHELLAKPGAKIEDIKGDHKEIAWGSQIRSYVFMPYTLAKDHRTSFENGNINAVMDGDIDGFINAYLKMQSQKNLENN